MKKYIVPLLSISVFIVLLIKGEINEHNLKANHKLATGFVDDYSWGMRTGVYLHYTFQNSGKTFQSGITLPIGKQFAYRFKNKTFPVIYYSDDPTKSSLLINPKDYEEYNLVFPDSLIWVKRYLNLR